MVKGSYDHHSAIYCLLLDRLTKQRASKTEDRKKRRPSTIAEQPLLVGIPGTENLQSLRLRTTSETDREQQQQQQQQHQQQQQQQQRRQPVGCAETAAVSSAVGNDSWGLGQTEFKCITCGSPIMDNTTSTTSCVKCARLRTRRLNFAHPAGLMRSSGGGLVSPSLGGGLGGPWDSRDSGVSSGSSQDCGGGELTPTVEHSSKQLLPAFPPLVNGGPLKSTQPAAVEATQFNKLVRKLSEVEGIDHRTLLRSMTRTSVDEGVELESCCCSSASLSSVGDSSTSSSGGGGGCCVGACCNSSSSSGCCGGGHTLTDQNPMFSCNGKHITQCLHSRGKADNKLPSSFETGCGVGGSCSLSLPSCQPASQLPQLFTARGPAAAAEPVSVSQLYRGMCRYNPLGPRVSLPAATAGGQPAAVTETFGVYPAVSGKSDTAATCSTAERGVTRSPVNFREGRRASDGLAQQGVIAFQQKLYAKERGAGFGQLYSARQEVLQLQSQLSAPSARLEEDWSSCQPAVLQLRNNSCCCHQPGTKRTSAPENLTATTTAALSSRHVALQQQLLQHRLQQKRHQSLQKHQQRYSLVSESSAMGSGVCGGGSGCCNSNNGHRRSVFGGGKPYLPADTRSLVPIPPGGAAGGGGGGVGGAGNEFLFHPIAEDEPYLDSCHQPPQLKLEGVPAAASHAFTAWQPACQPLPLDQQTGGVLQQDGWGMEGLPGQMERGCKLTAGGSPPPPP